MPGVVRCADRELDLRSPVVMGVLNVTPDSFSDGGRFVDVDAALHAALQMQRDGAAIIDVGGESTRPGATPISAREELDRILPVIEGLAGSCGATISVDTQKATVAHAALEAYGTWGEKTNYGKVYQGVIRSTFVIDPAGVIQEALYNVKATGHVARVRKLVGVDPS